MSKSCEVRPRIYRSCRGRGRRYAHRYMCYGLRSRELVGFRMGRLLSGLGLASGLLDSWCAVRHILIILSPAVSPLLMCFPVSYVSRAVLLILFRARFLCLDSHYVGFPRVFEHSHLLTLVLYLLYVRVLSLAYLRTFSRGACCGCQDSTLYINAKGSFRAPQ